MLTIVCFGDLWINKVIISFLQQLDLEIETKTQVQLYRFGINGLRPHDWATHLVSPQSILVIRCKTVDHNRYGKRQDKYSAEGAQPADKLAGKCRGRQLAVAKMQQSAHFFVFFNPPTGGADLS